MDAYPLKAVKVYLGCMTRSRNHGAVPRRALLLGAAAGLTGCAADEAPAPTTTARPFREALPAPPAEPPLAALRDAGPTLALEGERLDAAALRRFYARRGFEPAWAARPEQAAALAEAVLAAGSHGLDPGRFHAALLRRRDSLPPEAQELALSAAVLAYADALAHGQVPPARRRPAETLAPEPTPVDEALHRALEGGDAAAAIESLAPALPAYAALRTALRQAAPADAARRRTLAVNLERLRWLPRRLPAERVWVNVAEQQLTFFREDQAALSCRVVVGAEGEREQSPEFQASIEGIFYNPPWIVPADIAQRDILPRLRTDPGYLERRNMVLLPNGEVEQRAGPGAGLGFLLFDMPNRFDVFLHDTPARNFFTRPDRRLSYGCIRVEKPRELAALLKREPIEAINAEVAKEVTHRRALPAPVPVFIAYHTAFADAQGRVQFRPDFYGRDARIWEQLRGGAAA